MAARKRTVATPALVYTAQDVARFCEVDLKTIHHWADAGKIPHRRTEGRHLRFRRNHVLAFLHAHGYPLPSPITTERPTVFVASADASLDETAKRLAAKFHVRRFECAALAIARLLSEEPDALVIVEGDATWNEATAAALARDSETKWVHVRVVGNDLARLHLELARALDVA
jgi:excisionase family DNA binding protein